MARLTEIKATGATAAAVSRLERDGKIVRLSRGIYQLADAQIEAHHALAEASKRVPRGVVCLTSALAFHDLTDKMPARVWMAIVRTDRVSANIRPPIRFVRFPPRRLTLGITAHQIEGVPVPVTDPAYTVIDMFRYRSVAGLPLAIEGLKEVLRTRMATPAELARIATEERAWSVMRPYLEALAHGG
jgi:predicted transcriptional regulator of viral defense system